MTSCFGEQKIPMMTSANNVGTGWWDIIKELEEKLNAIDPNFDLLQVKEKFGALRYYAVLSQDSKHSTTDVAAFHDAIAEAEGRSDTTCEECGEPAEPKAYRGWLKTLCEKHGAEREARIKKELDELHNEHGGEA